MPIRSFRKRIIEAFSDVSEPLDPIVLIGCGRSGTTLLFQLMGNHEALASTKGYPDGEDHLVWNEYAKASVSGIGYVNINDGQVGVRDCCYQDEDDVTQSAIDEMRRYYKSIIKKDRSHRVVTKCPHLSNKLRFVQKIFPKAKFVHIVRDCLPVVASWREIFENNHPQYLYWPDVQFPCFSVINRNSFRAKILERLEPQRLYPTGGDWIIADYWSKTNTYVHHQLEDSSERLITVRYEDLCEEPVSTLNKIYEFCEISAITQSPIDSYGRTPQKTHNEKFLAAYSDAEIENINNSVHDVRQRYGYVE